MSIVSVAKVQQWLESTKLTLDDIDEEIDLVTTAKDLAFGMVGQAYDTASWLDEDSIPNLIQDAISMLVAAWIYNRAYAEDNSTGSSYAKWLEDKAYALLSSIGSGSIDLPEIPGVITNSSPSFYPRDVSFNEYDEREAAKFTMGSRF